MKEKGVKVVKKEEITLKNTKAEILEALNEALEREKELLEYSLINSNLSFKSLF